MKVKKVNKDQFIITVVLLSLAILILTAWSYATPIKDSGFKLDDSGNIVDTDKKENSSVTDTSNSAFDTSELAPIVKDKPEIGMSADQVKLTKWGKSKFINKTTTINGISEQWVYADSLGNTFGYVYLDNGIVTSIQESN